MNPFNFNTRFLFSVLLFWLAILLPFFLHAQTATLRGFVYDKSDGEPVIFANVYFIGTGIGSATDANGYYSITNIPPGDYSLTVSYLGYDTLRIPFTFRAGQVITRSLYITKSAIELQAVEISAEKQAAQTEVRTSVITITPKQIKQLPTVGGEPEIAQYLQVLPGVIFTGDQGGQLYIRGGTPIQNKVLLDGMTVYNPFHSIGLFSVFDSDIIRTCDVYTGGFNAEYGDRVSSVMDIKTRDGNKKRFAGKLSANPFTSKLLIEGPIRKYSEDNPGSITYILSAKSSYLKESSKLFYPYNFNSDGKIISSPGGLPYTFNDFYGKLSVNSASGSRVNFFGFNFIDRVNYQFISDLRWNSYGFGSNFILVPALSPLLVDGNFSYSKYDISLQEADGKLRASSITGFNAALNFSYFSSKNELKYWLEVAGFSTDFEFYNSANRYINEPNNTTELAGFLRYQWTVGQFIFEPSFRLQYYASFPYTSPEPRLGIKYNATDNIRIKFGGGLYSQNLFSAVSDRDVVNLFYGFLSGPFQSRLQDSVYFIAGGDTLAYERKHGLQTARHAILGFEYDLGTRITMTLEGYYKKFTQLTNLNRNKIFDDIDQYKDKPYYQRLNFIIETGDAYGFDFVLKYDYKRWYVWAVYSQSYVTRFDGLILYPPHFDRRHNVNLVASYNFGKDLTWEFDARWNYGSGFPFTKTAGFYEKISFEDINQNYLTANGELAYVYGPINDGRLPDYHRLDLTVKKKFFPSENSTLEVVASVVNAYNRQNIFYFDRIRYERVDQLPILPSFGISWSF
ncbi:MAG: TonB-dependent receptor [Bacteroidetes bacterium]|nr:TonB-dependent receptor [Bacteroidota bacterium]